jgi:beta-lactam-binding protein with PASTA domain/predicted Ser/Thr protein kinase
MMEVAENQIVDGRYRVLSRIGSGGMADVWGAEDTHLQRRVALKVLHNRFAQDREFVERFRREAEAAAGLQHPNVVGVFDRGQADGTYYIAMEYLDGRPLKELIDAGLTPTESVSIVRQILEAARFAHRHGVIHRDLKPQNVIVDSEGKATVTDFGIARAGVSEITQTGSVMGTAHYLSPEQAQGLEVTAASDLYSIGVILYECLTGTVPFEAESAVAIALKQVSQTPRRPSAINPEVSPALDAVVMRALEKDPGRRFRDADAFIHALDAAEREPQVALRGADTAAFAPLPPADLAERKSPPAGLPPAAPSPADRRRRRRWILVAFAAAIGVIAGLALSRDTTTEVPNVTNPFGTNQELSAAISQLDAEGFDVAEVRRVQRDLPRDTVIEQDPPPGDGSLDCAFLSFFCDKPPVTLTVSAGPGKAKVPDVVGHSQSEAERELDRAGFESSIETSPSDQFEEGTVIASDPAAGTRLTRGKAVILTVSTGPVPVRVPDVTGQSESSAAAELQEAGLAVDSREQESDQPEGQVIGQSPDSGTRVEEGSTVIIFVSKGPGTVAVPGLIGLTREQAASELQDAGLSVGVSEVPTTDPPSDGRVIRQSPTGGTRLRRGSTVTIFLGVFEVPTIPTTPTEP